MKAIQETDRPPQLVVPVSGRLKVSGKLGLRLNTSFIKGVIIAKKRPEFKIYF